MTKLKRALMFAWHYLVSLATCPFDHHSEIAYHEQGRYSCRHCKRRVWWDPSTRHWSHHRTARYGGTL